MKRIIFTPMFGLLVFLLGLLLLVSGCATSPDKISAAYVSPIQYQSYSCEQIGQEVNRIGRALQEVTQIQSKEASGDTRKMTVGLLFFLEGDTGREAEIARLKGEAETIQAVSIQKNCQEVLQQIEYEKEQAKKMKELAKEDKDNAEATPE